MAFELHRKDADYAIFTFFLVGVPSAATSNE
jgi:hypothetical protein